MHRLDLVPYASSMKTTKTFILATIDMILRYIAEINEHDSPVGSRSPPSMPDILSIGDHRWTSYAGRIPANVPAVDHQRRDESVRFTGELRTHSGDHRSRRSSAFHQSIESRRGHGLTGRRDHHLVDQRQHVHLRSGTGVQSDGRYGSRSHAPMLWLDQREITVGKWRWPSRSGRSHIESLRSSGCTTPYLSGYQSMRLSQWSTAGNIDLQTCRADRQACLFLPSTDTVVLTSVTIPSSEQRRYWALERTMSTRWRSMNRKCTWRAMASLTVRL